MLVAATRQRRSVAEKRRIVEETSVDGASVARVARAHGINANQVFGWRRLYLVGRLGDRKAAMKLLPVRVSESLPAHLPVRGSADFSNPQPGTIHIELRQARVRTKAVPMRRWCACCWSAYGDDRAADEHASLDCRRSDGLASRLHGAKCAGREQAEQEAVLGAGVCVSRAGGDLIKVLGDGDGLCCSRSDWSTDVSCGRRPPAAR